MNVKSFLLFISGLAIGGTVGIFGSKKYFQDKYQKRYEEDHDALEKYYQKVDEYARVDHEDEIEEIATEGNSKPNGRMSEEERAAVKEKLNRNWEETTNYAGIYQVHEETKVDPAEKEYPIEIEEDSENKTCEICSHYDPEKEWCSIINEQTYSDEVACDNFDYRFEDQEVTPEEEAFDDYQKNKNKPPKIISAEAYSDLPAHIDKTVLYLYTYDEIITDEDNEDEPIDDPERLIGDALTKYGFIENDENIIFVMNYDLSTCYEIQKIDAAWGDSH